MYKFSHDAADDDDVENSRAKNYEKFPWARLFKLTTSLANETLIFQMLISQICQYFLLKKCEKLFHIFNKKYQCNLLLSRKTLNKLTS